MAWNGMQLSAYAAGWAQQQQRTVDQSTPTGSIRAVSERAVRQPIASLLRVASLHKTAFLF